MEFPLPPDLARKLLNKDLANLVQRVQMGGKLTRAEHAMLQNVARNTPVFMECSPKTEPCLMRV